MQRAGRSAWKRRSRRLLALKDRAGQKTTGLDDDDLFDEDEFAKESGATGGTCEQLLLSKDNDKRVLFAMAIGIEADDDSITDFNLEPYASSKLKSKFKPTASILLDEINRRVNILSAKQVKAKNWKEDKKIHWLKANPILDKIDVEFLKKEVAAHKKLLEDAAAEKAKAKENKQQVWNQ